MDDPFTVNLQTWARRALDPAAAAIVDSARLGRFILRVGRPVPVVLACGADLGQLCRELDRLGASAHGVEAAPEALALARVRYPNGNLRHGDLRKLEFADASFDGAMLGAALCRLPRAQGQNALLEVHRVLRMGALLGLDLLLGKGEGFTDTPHGRLYACRWSEAEFVSACDALDMQRIESGPVSPGRQALLLRREY